MKRNITYALIALASIQAHNISAISSLKKISSFLNGEQYEATVHKEYPLSGDKKKVVTVTNIQGSIHITEWDQNTVVLYAIKKTSSVKNLKALEVLVGQDVPGELTISTCYKDEDTKGAVDYTLIVPKGTTITLVTEIGNIIAQGLSGSTHATTTRGDIELANIEGTITAFTKEYGDITIAQAENDVKADTHNGKITIIDVQKNVLAASEHGKIEVTCKKLDNNAKLWLKTISGNITVELAGTISASLEAKTERGCVTCEHDITITPFTTKLNNSAWKQFKQEVAGTLGNDGNSHGNIKIQTQKGNISVV